MQTLKKTIFVYVEPCEWAEGGFYFTYFDKEMEHLKQRFIGLFEVEIEAPDTHTIKSLVAATLDAKKTAIMAEARLKITQIESQKQSLLALENNPCEQ